MSTVADVVAGRYDEPGGIPEIARALFPDPTPAGVAAALETYCEHHLGATIQACEFFDLSVGSVHGLVLADGRRIVVKVHARRVAERFLRGVQRVQEELARGGFPAPAPVAAPVAVGTGLATAETLLDRGERADPRNPEVRRAMAAGLAGLVARCRSLPVQDDLRLNAMRVDPGRLWPVPHDPRFDFEATAAGAEWIDGRAAEARRVLAAAGGKPVIGHADWRAEHLRFDRDRICAVFDWDSLAVLPEPVLAGSAAHGFTADWELEDRRQLPSLEEALAFVADYEIARGRPFTVEERSAARASLVYTMAYTARCEHADGDDRQAEARAFLRAHAGPLLSRRSPTDR